MDPPAGEGPWSSPEVWRLLWGTSLSGRASKVLRGSLQGQPQLQRAPTHPTEVPELCLSWPEPPYSPHPSSAAAVLCPRGSRAVIYGAVTLCQ